MATSKSRIQRGRQSQEIAAKYYREHGAPDADPVPASLPGMDVRNVPRTAPEVKARRDFDPQAWLRQAKKNAGEGDLAYVIVRPDGAGPESIASWPVVIRFGDLVELQREAGYW